MTYTHMAPIARGIDRGVLRWEISHPLDRLGSIGSETVDLEAKDQGSVLCAFSEAEPGHSVLLCG